MFAASTVIKFLLLFLALVVVHCTVLAWLSRWNLLAAAYRSSLPFGGEHQRVLSGRLRGVAPYRGILRVGVGKEGVFLSTVIPFRLFHPTLLIPRAEVVVDRGLAATSSMTRFRFARVPGITLEIPADAARELGLV